MDERSKYAFDCARDTTKQLITLATGVIALTITFVSDFALTLGPGLKFLLLTSWGFYFLSLLGGLWALMAMTGSIGKAELKENSELSIFTGNITVPAGIQVIFFGIATLLATIFGALSLF